MARTSLEVFVVDSGSNGSEMVLEVIEPSSFPRSRATESPQHRAERLAVEATAAASQRLSRPGALASISKRGEGASDGVIATPGGRLTKPHNPYVWTV